MFAYFNGLLYVLNHCLVYYSYVMANGVLQADHLCLGAADVLNRIILSKGQNCVL